MPLSYPDPYGNLHPDGGMNIQPKSTPVIPGIPVRIRVFFSVFSHDRRMNYLLPEFFVYPHGNGMARRFNDPDIDPSNTISVFI